MFASYLITIVPFYSTMSIGVLLGFNMTYYNYKCIIIMNLIIISIDIYILIIIFIKYNAI